MKTADCNRDEYFDLLIGSLHLCIRDTWLSLERY